MSKIAGIAIPARRNAKVWTDAKDRPVLWTGRQATLIRSKAGLPAKLELK